MKVDVEYKLKLEVILSLLQKGMSQIETSNNKELVLLLGKTGSGKSTTGCYLLGQQFEYKRVPHPEGGSKRVLSLLNDERAIFPIGHQGSETLYTHSTTNPFFKQKTNCYLTDCPGFVGDRTIEEGVVESISCELAVRNAKAVKCVVMVIPFADLTAPRITTSGFMHLLNIINKLFLNSEDIIKNAIFAITHFRAEDDIDEILYVLNNNLKIFQKKIEDMTAADVDALGLTRADYCNNVTITNFIKEKLLRNSPQNPEIIFINPADNGESREKILNAIKNKNSSFTINDFVFNSYDLNRQKFNDLIFDMAAQAVRNMSDTIQAIKTIKLNCTSLNLTRNEIKISEAVVQCLEKTIFDEEQLIKSLHSQIEKNKFSMGDLENKARSTNTAIAKYKSELEEITGARGEQIEEFKSIHVSLTRRENSCIREYIHPEGAELFMRGDYNGGFLIELENHNLKNGHCHIKFSRYLPKLAIDFFNLPIYSQGFVHLSTRRKDIPDNLARRKVIESELKAENNRLIQLSADIDNLKKTNQRCVKNLSETQSGHLKEKPSKLKKIEAENSCITSINRNINQLLNEIDALTLEAREAVRLLEGNKTQYELIERLVNNKIRFPEDVVEIFLNKYRLFFKILPQLNAILYAKNIETVNLDTVDIESFDSITTSQKSSTGLNNFSKNTQNMWGRGYESVDNNNNVSSQSGKYSM